MRDIHEDYCDQSDDETNFESDDEIDHIHQEKLFFRILITNQYRNITRCVSDCG